MAITKVIIACAILNTAKSCLKLELTLIKINKIINLKKLLQQTQTAPAANCENK